MTVDHAKPKGQLRWWSVLQRKDVLSGLLFMGVAAFGLLGLAELCDWHRIEHGHRLHAAAAAIGPAGARGGDSDFGAVEIRAASENRRGWGAAWRPVVFVAVSLVVFGLTLERLGLVLSILLLTGIGGAAARSLRPLEIAIAALVLIALCWLIFIVGLSLTIPVWPTF